MIDKCELTATRVDPSRPRAARVLLLESGTGAGGSVNFLRDFLLNVDVTGMDPRAGFYFPNTSKTLKEIEQFGFSVTIFSSALPSAASGRPGVFDRRLKKIRFVRSLYRVVLRLLTIQLPIAWRVLRYIRKERIDLVVLNQDVHFHIPGVLAARLAGVPCVCRKAGGIGEARSLKRALNPWVELFVSISAATDADQRQTPGTKRLIKIYEGLDLSRFASPASREAMRDELAIPPGKKVVAAISRVEKGKGQMEFLQMAAQVRQRYSDVHFLVVGDQGSEGGSLMNDLKAATRTLGIEQSVVFTGWRDDIPAVMACVDIFVHCPTTFIEGLARTCLEAMAMRIPAVVSDNGGMADAVEDGVTGFVVAPGDIGGMADAVTRLLADEELCQEFGLNARRRIERLFDMTSTSRQLQEALLEAIPAGRPEPNRRSASVAAR